jgi:hypothetical protein
VTNSNGPGASGIAIDAKNVKVRGNQVIGEDIVGEGGVGIVAVESNPGPMLIEGNQVAVWSETGILARGVGKTVSKNQVSLVNVGIDLFGPSTATGNVVTESFVGIQATEGANVIGNALLGNSDEGIGVNGSAGTITRNNIMGNGGSTGFLGSGQGNNCGLSNVSTDHAIAAPNNYWGAPSGPGPDPADQACNTPGNTTTTDPVAAKPFKVKAPIKP